MSSDESGMKLLDIDQSLELKMSRRPRKATKLKVVSKSPRARIRGFSPIPFDDPKPDPFEVSDEDESLPGPSTATDCTPKINKYKRPDKSRCKFYWNRRKSDGTWVFHKKLLKYFMTPDSPDYHDLKNKRFNTSFLHERRRGPRDIQIFEPEELGKPIIPLPDIKVNVTDGPPGEKYVHLFKNMPSLVGELDDEIKKAKEEHKELKRERRMLKKTTGKAVKTPRFGKVTHLMQKIPDQHLITDYEKIFGKGFRIEPEVPFYSVPGMSLCENGNDVLSFPNAPCGENSSTSSEDSYVTASQVRKVRNPPRISGEIVKQSDEGKLLNKEEVLRKGATNVTLEKLSSDELTGCKGKKKGKPKLVAANEKKKKPKSAAGFNEKKAAKSAPGSQEKKVAESIAGSNSKKAAESVGGSSGKKTAKSASLSNEKRKLKSTAGSVVKKPKHAAGFKKQKLTGRSDKKLRSTVSRKGKESGGIQAFTTLPNEEVIDNRVLRVTLHKLSIGE